LAARAMHMSEEDSTSARPARLQSLDRLDARLGTPRGRVLALLAVLLVAGCLRLVYAAQVSETADHGRLAVDALGYDRQARGVLEGEWPGDEVFYQDALYPFFVAAHYRFVGDEPTRVFTTQALLGVLAAVLVGVLATLVLSPSEGLLAGLLAAAYGPFLFYEQLLLKAALSTACLTAFLVALVVARRRGVPAALGAGVLLGACCLLRGNLLALVPIACLWLALPREGTGLGRRAGSVVALLLGAGLVISPVTLHNVRAGEFVLITSQAGQNFYIGNNPGNDTGSYVPPAGVRGIQTFEQIDFARLAEDEVGHALTPTERSRFWFDKAFAFFRDEPGAALALQWKKLALFLNHLEVPDNADYLTTRQEVPLLRAPLPTFSVLLVLACAALVLRRPTADLGLVVAIGLTISATVVAFYVFSRYRLPVVPILLVLAAALPRALLEAVDARRFGRIGLALGLALVATLVTSRDVWGGNRSMLHYNRALFAHEDGDADAAYGHIDRALQEDAANWYALLLRAKLREAEDDLAAAIHDVTAACEAAPGAAIPRYELGLLLEELRDLEGARAAYRDAVRGERHDLATTRLADLERRLGDPTTARALLEEVLARRPQFFPALRALGSLLLELDQPAAALPILERASERRPDDPLVRRDLASCRRLLGD